MGDTATDRDRPWSAAETRFEDEGRKADAGLGAPVSDPSLCLELRRVCHRGPDRTLATGGAQWG